MSYHAPWPEERTAALRFHVLGGHMSYSGIAAALNNEFGSNYSRNSAIGKAARLGLTNPYWQKMSAMPRAPRKPQPYKPRPKRQPMFVQEVALECKEMRGLTIMECGENECRWPSGENASEYRFCGHRKTSVMRNGEEIQVSYCDTHYRQSIRS